MAFLKKNPEEKPEESDDQKFIKKDDNSNDSKNSEEIKNNSEIVEIIDELKNKNIFPKNNQQRNLDREVGGIEEKEPKEIDSKDIWDDRSEEVDKMGSHNPIGTSGKRSMIWMAKKKKAEEKKHAKSADAAIAAKESNKKPQENIFDSSQTNQNF